MPEEVLMPVEVLVELAEVDGKTIRGMQLMPLGEWKHPRGTIKITPERAASFARQFERRVAGQDLPILYIHSDAGNKANPLYGQAAGWITKVYADEQRGVLIDADLTDDGVDAVQSKKYRYLSAEYFDKVQLPHHDAPETDVLVGAALVNRPHLKGKDPILNEETGHQFLMGGDNEPGTDPEGGGPVDPILQQLCEAAGIELSEDQTELTEDQRSKLESHLQNRESQVTTLTEENADLKRQLAEKDPEGDRQRSLSEAGFTEEATLLAEYRADRTERQFVESIPEGFKPTKPFTDAVRAYGLTLDESKLAEALELSLAGKATVEVGERGSNGPGKEGSIDNPELELDKLAKAKQKELGDDTSYFEALQLVMADPENRELAEAYDGRHRAAGGDS